MEKMKSTCQDLNSNTDNFIPVKQPVTQFGLVTRYPTQQPDTHQQLVQQSSSSVLCPKTHIQAQIHRTQPNPRIHYTDLHGYMNIRDPRLKPLRNLLIYQCPSATESLLHIPAPSARHLGVLGSKFEYQARFDILTASFTFFALPKLIFTLIEILRSV